MAWLISLLINIGIPQRFAKPVLIGIGVIGIVLILGVAKCSYDKSVINAHEAEMRASEAEDNRKASEIAAARRLADQRRNDAEEGKIRDAVSAAPSAPLTPRQRARACAILKRQGQTVQACEGATP